MPKKHECSVCKKTFGNSGHLNRHKSTHDEDKLIQCTEPSCDKSFARRDNMLRHAASHIPHELCEFPCEVENCGKRFPSKEKLLRHTKTHDPNYFPLECPQCDMRFLKKNLRAEHLHLVHKVPKMFPCEFPGCDMAFMRYGDRNTHVRKKHSQKQLFCMHEDCVEVPPFSTIKLFNDHTRTAHPKNVCPDCGKKFHGPQSLRMHQEVHAIPILDRYKFKCEYADCIARYTKQTNLDMHIRAKHEKITYDCTMCDAGLSTKFGLKRHYILMHKMQEQRAVELSGHKGRKRRRSISSV